MQDLKANMNQRKFVYTSLPSNAQNSNMSDIVDEQHSAPIASKFTTSFLPSLLKFTLGKQNNSNLTSPDIYCSRTGLGSPSAPKVCTTSISKSGIKRNYSHSSNDSRNSSSCRDKLTRAELKADVSTRQNLYCNLYAFPPPEQLGLDDACVDDDTDQGGAVLCSNDDLMTGTAGATAKGEDQSQMIEGGGLVDMADFASPSPEPFIGTVESSGARNVSSYKKQFPPESMRNGINTTIMDIELPPRPYTSSTKQGFTMFDNIGYRGSIASSFPFRYKNPDAMFSTIDQHRRRSHLISQGSVASDSDDGNSSTVLSSSTFTLEYEEEYDDRYDAIRKPGYEGDDVMSDVTYDKKVRRRHFQSNHLSSSRTGERGHTRVLESVPFSGLISNEGPLIPWQRNGGGSANQGGRPFPVVPARGTKINLGLVDRCRIESEIYNDIHETESVMARSVNALHQQQQQQQQQQQLLTPPVVLRYQDSNVKIYRGADNVIGSIEDLRRYRRMKFARKYKSTNFECTDNVKSNNESRLTCDIVQMV